MTVLPVRSTRAAPGGAGTSPRRPTRVNRPFSTRNAESSIGAPPSPAIRRAPSYSVTVAGGGGLWPLAPLNPATTRQRAIANRKARIDGEVALIIVHLPTSA